MTLFAGRYRILEALGSGAQGAAFRVADTHSSQSSAAVLKVGRSGHELTDGTLSEFEALRGLTTPYIAPVIRLGFASANDLELIATHANVSSVEINQNAALRPFLIRAWVDGLDLFSWSQRHVKDGAGSPEDLCRVLAHLTESVAALHHAELIHSDLKPVHVLISQVADPSSAKPILIDFGLAISNGAAQQGDQGKSDGFAGGRHQQSNKKAI